MAEEGGSSMNCVAFERWLDDGMLEETRDAAERHAEHCARCAAALAAALEIDALLDAAPAAAPTHFSERVMARVRTAAARPTAQAIVRPPFAWWVEAASEPATALAVAIAGLLLWQGRTLVAAAAMFIAKSAAAIKSFDLSTPAALDLSHPGIGWAIMLVAGLVATWGSWELYHWTARTFALRSTRARH
jgi:hypothetical protein